MNISFISNTLTQASIYALVSVGFVALYRATRILSFAQGAFMVIGAITFVYVTNHGASLFVGLAVALVAAFVFGGVLYRLFLVRLSFVPPFVAAIATVGLAGGIEALTALVWGSAPLVVRPGVISTSNVPALSSLHVQYDQLASMVGAIVACSVVYLVIERSKLGLRMRSIADSASLADLVGVPVRSVSSLSWALGGAMAGLAGVAFTLTSQPDPSAIVDLSFVAFPVILLGGLESVGGVIVASLVIAAVQDLVTVYVNPDFANPSAYIILLVVLVFKPNGLFGARGAVERL